jgi:hypothetical protein
MNFSNLKNHSGTFVGCFHRRTVVDRTAAVLVGVRDQLRDRTSGRTQEVRGRGGGLEPVAHVHHPRHVVQRGLTLPVRGQQGGRSAQVEGRVAVRVGQGLEAEAWMTDLTYVVT